MADLDFRRLEDYLRRVLGEEPPDREDEAEWARRLGLFEFSVGVDSHWVPTVDGMLLFGSTPRKFLAQSGIRAIAYPGTSESYETLEDATLSGSLVGLRGSDGEIVEAGLVEQALSFVVRNTRSVSAVIEGVQIDTPAYPDTVVREVVVNALVHRDYSVQGSDVTLAVFSDH